ncbi:MAG: FkbM family methyltransferase [Saprospiraceae bacterium]|nr:FkbM family methyltransferase [Saprospiraceae bacterium]
MKKAAYKHHYNAWYKNIRVQQSANNSIIFYLFYRFFYRPKKGTLAELLDVYSKSIPPPLMVVQVGANDGITHDPIHKFIKRDHWNGVLLEPQKEVFPTLARVYHKNKGITVLNAALDKADGEKAIYKIGFSTARWATGLTTFDKATLEKAFASGYVARKAAEEGVSVPQEVAERIKCECVQLISPATLLHCYALKKIDLLQIDTEGYDFEIIKMLDFAIIKPELIIFESKHLSTAAKTACFDYLKANGYQLKTFGANTASLQKGHPLAAMLM